MTGAHWPLLISALLTLTPVSLVAAQTTPAGGLAVSLAELRAGRAVRVQGERIEPTPELLSLYGSDAAPIWRTDAAADLLVAVRSAMHDGLTPLHYHARALDATGASDDPQLDLLRTDALVRLARDLRNGRGRPTAEARAATPAAGPDELLPVLQRAIASGDVTGTLAVLRPPHFIYQGLREALATLRGIEASGGWAIVPGGPSLRRDSSDARVPLLRARLRHSGDLTHPSAPGASLVFDAELEAAVRRFQHRHGLNEDGIVGPRTRAALNVPVEDRIAAVRVNLERARWIARDLPQRFVVVNVAGARAYMISEGNVVFETRVIVGKTATSTPVFTATMTQVELNPTWTVPRSINGEVLSSIRRDARYLSREGIRVFTHGGSEVSRDAIDYSSYTGRTFPYVFRQEPGPANALGRIKLLFPNPFNVYLHDTPARGLFAQEQRLFSHGCVRVEQPVELAARALDDPAWTVETLGSAIATGRTRTIELRSPLPVMILYWTASTDLHGELHFYADVYNRDSDILAALSQP